MRRCSILLSVVVVVLLGSAVVLSLPPAAAQEATPAAALPATADHPLVGTWVIVTDLGEDTFPSVANFNADGTYTEVLPWGIVILGASRLGRAIANRPRLALWPQRILGVVFGALALRLAFAARD